MRECEAKAYARPLNLHTAEHYVSYVHSCEPAMPAYVRVFLRVGGRTCQTAGAQAYICYIIS